MRWMISFLCQLLDLWVGSPNTHWIGGLVDPEPIWTFLRGETFLAFARNWTPGHQSHRSRCVWNKILMYTNCSIGAIWVWFNWHYVKIQRKWFMSGVLSCRGTELYNCIVTRYFLSKFWHIFMPGYHVTVFVYCNNQMHDVKYI